MTGMKTQSKAKLEDYYKILTPTVFRLVHYEVYSTSPFSRLLSIKNILLIVALGPSVSVRPCLY